MNGQHWTHFTEAELARVRAGRTIRASRRGHAPQPQPQDVTDDARQALAGASEPAYPAEWLPEVQARAGVRASQTPAEWLEQNGPDPHKQRNGTAPAGSPAADAYPSEWLTDADIRLPGSGGLGGEGFLNGRRVA